MSYEINFTDSVNKGFIQVDDKTVNTETSLSLPGRTKSDYGKIILENLLHMLENFANNNPPPNPVEGQLWYDTTVGVDQMKVYDGSQWVSASSIKKGSFRPEAVESRLGDLWVDTANQQLKLYNGNEWLIVGPEFSEGAETGVKPVSDIIDITNTEQKSVITYIDGKSVFVVSKDEFTPKTPIEGPNAQSYSTIRPGLNLAPGLKYYGMSEVAESLFVQGDGNVLASSFARRDRDNTFTRPIRIQNNGGISIGETPTVQLAVIGQSNAIFRNLASGGNIQFRLGSAASSALTISPPNRVGINKTNPEKSLDIVGDLAVSNDATFSSNINVVGDSQINGILSVSGNTNIQNLTVSDILPTDTGKNIGTSNNRFNNIFAQSVISTNFTGNFNGQLSGNASTSTGWSSSVTLRFNGDVEATQGDIVFGTAGNLGLKEISLQLNPEFIIDRDLITQISNTDELLLITSDGGTQEIKKTTQEDLVKRIPTTEVRRTAPAQPIPGSIGPLMPVGAIIPFGGNVLPNGWLFCDGSIVRRSAYESLFAAIGTRFNGTMSVSSVDFRLPDLRGRFPLGNLDMANSSVIQNTDADLSIVVSEPDATVVGAKGGTSSATIESENIPDHTHTLSGDAEPTPTKFYAVSNETNAPDSGVDSLAPSMIGTNPGSFISQTGGVQGDSGEPLSIVNPFQTINYIIYTGVHS